MDQRDLEIRALRDEVMRLRRMLAEAYGPPPNVVVEADDLRRRFAP